MAEFSTTIRNLCAAQNTYTSRQFSVLLYCADTQDASKRETRVIAGALNISKPAVTRATDLLQTQGYIKREVVATDRRCVCLSLTKEGQKFVAHLQEGAPIKKARKPATATAAAPAPEAKAA